MYNLNKWRNPLQIIKRKMKFLSILYTYPEERGFSFRKYKGASILIFPAASFSSHQQYCWLIFISILNIVYVWSSSILKWYEANRNQNWIGGKLEFCPGGTRWKHFPCLRFFQIYLLSRVKNNPTKKVQQRCHYHDGALQLSTLARWFLENPGSSMVFLVPCHYIKKHELPLSSSMLIEMVAGKQPHGLSVS